jgi:hypothetical protein
VTVQVKAVARELLSSACEVKFPAILMSVSDDLNGEYSANFLVEIIAVRYSCEEGIALTSSPLTSHDLN